ncbi:MAG: head-tail connector protein [Pseudomonadota bacterium]
MSLVIITQPTDPVVSLDEVKAHLRVDHDDDDVEIAALINAAITEFEDPNLGWLGRSISERELELRVDAFPHHNAYPRMFVLPTGPLLIGTVGDDTYDFSVKYDDADGVEQTLADSVYRVLDAHTARPFISLKTGQSWPATTRCEPQSVRVRFWAGYPADDSRLEAFKAAVKLHVEMIYDGDSPRQDKLRESINALLQPYRVYSL